MLHSCRELSVFDEMQGAHDHDCLLFHSGGRPCALGFTVQVLPLSRCSVESTRLVETTRKTAELVTAGARGVGRQTMRPPLFVSFNSLLPPPLDITYASLQPEIMTACMALSVNVLMLHWLSNFWCERGQVAKVTQHKLEVQYTQSQSLFRTKTCFSVLRCETRVPRSTLRPRRSSFRKQF